MRRFPNWTRALREFLESRRDVQFAWGTHDCCVFAADAVLAMTGIDLADSYRGYDTKEAAREIIRIHGGLEGLAESIATRHGLAEILPGYAQRGDVVLVRGPLAKITGPSLGVIGLDSRPTVVASRGFRYAPLAIAERAWGVR